MYILTLASGFNLLILMSLLGCYGVPPAKASEDWMCSRCSANALEEVSFPHCFIFPVTLGFAQGRAFSCGLPISGSLHSVPGTQ